MREWIEQDNDGDLRDIAQSETLSESSTMSNISRLSKISSATTRKRKQVNFIIFSYTVYKILFFRLNEKRKKLKKVANMKILLFLQH